MNNLQNRRQDAVRLAEFILSSIEGVLRIDFRGDAEYMKRAEACKRILRSNAKRQRPEVYDVELLHRSLNISIESLEIKLHSTEHGTVFYLQPLLVKLRKLAEDTILFLDLFLKTPALLECHPLGVCDCEDCEKLFVRRNPRGRYCSDECRERAWRKTKLNKNPDYYAKNAREARSARKALKHSSMQRKSKPTQHEKQVSRRIAAVESEFLDDI